MRSQFERRLEEQYAFNFVAEGQMEGSMLEDASEEYVSSGIGQLFGGEDEANGDGTYFGGP